jgi:hypothetical protein
MSEDLIEQKTLWGAAVLLSTALVILEIVNPRLLDTRSSETIVAEWKQKNQATKCHGQENHLAPGESCWADDGTVYIAIPYKMQ